MTYKETVIDLVRLQYHDMPAIEQEELIKDILDSDAQAISLDQEEHDSHEHYCTACSGSGEGSYDGSICLKCKGTGEE